MIEYVLVKPALEIERGYRAYFAPTQDLEYFTGSIFAILGSHSHPSFSFVSRITQLMLSRLSGDHKSQAELAGLRAARARFASRYSLCPKEYFWKTRSQWSNGERPARRDPEESYRILQAQAAILSRSGSRSRSGAIGEARQILKEHGFIDKPNAVCHYGRWNHSFQPLLSHST